MLVVPLLGMATVALPPVDRACPLMLTGSPFPDTAVTKGKQVIIHKLLIPVDLKKIKDLQQLLALLQEVEDYAAANEDGEPGDDEDAAPAPA